MSSAKHRPRWFFLITPRWLAWHAFAVFAAWGMLWLGDWQYHRALGGNALSWAYTFEWPIFTIFGVVFWAKTIIDEYRSPGGAATSSAELSAAATSAAAISSMATGGAASSSAVSSSAATSAIAAAGQAGLDSDSLPAGAHTAATLDEEADDDPELAAYNAYLAKLNARAGDPLTRVGSL
jgi:hypothetical protein